MSELLVPIVDEDGGLFIAEWEHVAYSRGEWLRSYCKLGAHVGVYKGKWGAHFAVWAPNASRVSVVGDFNSWRLDGVGSMRQHDGSGIWEAFVSGASLGDKYKFNIENVSKGYVAQKADPCAVQFDIRPSPAAVISDLTSYKWHDDAWLETRASKHALDEPMSIYEMHLGSWQHFAGSDSQSQVYESCRVDAALPPVTYKELAEALPRYIKEMGFTHVEFLPIMEHPYDGSWGYQITGYFAPTSRYGTAQEFMALVDALHQNGIGVILDIVPAHFAVDEHGLVAFDGTSLYEHPDPQQSQHPDWGTYVFDFGRKEVGAFLISHALYWADVFHIDGFRVDAVASMIYLDYSRAAGNWSPNKHGGRENLEALAFLRRFNEELYSEHPHIVTIAEESTSWPMVSRPTYLGGLGFGFKWNMGWMHDVLKYCSRDPIFRCHHHNELIFSMSYAYHENYVLSISHDEVVHGKDSIVRKMPGHWWERYAQTRLLFGFTYGHPGKKLLFMGNEIGTWNEWHYKRALEWGLLERPYPAGIQRWVKDLNHLLLSHSALHEVDFSNEGFEWIDCYNSAQNIVSFLRYNRQHTECVLVVCNFAPVEHTDFVLGVPYEGNWIELLNSDAECYCGSGLGNSGMVTAETVSSHGQSCSLRLCIPPSSVLFLCPETQDSKTVEEW